jgi:hypothetical protein
VHTLHHILTTQTEPRGFIKPSLYNQAVYMELSLRMSFYLRCSLGSYTVSINAGFPVKIVEALAP